ncbi:MAG: hypothetical protein HND44_02095 [Chloroflexi bacterium]|nr:hypothetical protein [Ardenticatenaceae bacterium]NOG33351.1 hypothetical protein [Chloroflexota bacterium]GIK56175.1 MAG: hypothetical protein BroJett015_18380 [Chloroflexota bacterium]
MKQQITCLTILLLILITGARLTRAADAVVGNGDPASCTEAAFDTALTTASSGGGIITFNCGPAVTTITLSSTKFLTLGNVTVNGNGRIILDANNNDRHFFAGPGITFRLQNITLRQGNSLVNGGAVEASGAEVILENVQFLDNTSSVAGGAIYCYDGSLTIANSLFQNNTADTAGAIFNDGCDVTITGATFASNQATGGLGRGGAVENSTLGSLTVQHSRFSGNSALDGGGLYVAAGATAVLHSTTFSQNSGGYGGGIENSGAITITHSLLTANDASGSGGGLWNIGGTAVVQQTSFIDNFAYEGGGISTYGASLTMHDVNLLNNVANLVGGGATDGGGLYHAGGTVFITNATISGNVAMNNGGGIFQASDDNLTLTNVTLTNNTAAGLGGAFYHYGRYAILSNVTLGDNIAGIAGNAIYEDSPQTPQNPGVVQTVNSVIIGSAVNCDGGLFLSLGHNISQGSCASFSDATDQDNYVGDLLLGSPAFNGGAFSMQTILPLPGSPLIDAGDAGFCQATDQRSAARVGICDVGAVEYGAVAFRLYLPVVVR